MSDPIRMAEAATAEAETVPLQSGRVVAIPTAASIRAEHGRRDWIARRAQAVGDSLAISLAFLIAISVENEGTGLGSAWMFIPLLPAWVILFRAYGLYDRDTRRIGHGALDDVPDFFHALVVGGLGLWVYSRLVVSDQLAFVEMFAFGIAAMGLLIVSRYAIRATILRSQGAERTLILGGGASLDQLVRKLRSHPEYGLDPVGLVSDPDASAPEPVLPLMGRDLAGLDVAAVIERHRIEHVIASPTAEGSEATYDALEQCRRLGVKVSVLPRHVDAMGSSVVIGDIEGITVIGLNPLVLSRSSRYLKRTMDLAGASLGLVVAAPLFLLTAVAIKLDGRGPVLFSQQRYGQAGEPFRLYKFRTMSSDAEQRRDELAELSQDPNWLKLERDPRITRVGRLLRSTSIDELPQLWNVLRGEMSLVGPRPLIEEEQVQVMGWESARLDLRPGITGYWQVLGRTNIPFEEMVKLDYLYVTNWSLWSDIKLLLRTIPAVVSRRGVN